MSTQTTPPSTHTIPPAARRGALALLAAAALAALPACEETATDTAADTGQQPTSPARALAGSMDAAEGIADDITRRNEQALAGIEDLNATGATAGRIEAGGLVFDVPTGWQAETPANSMRLAQFAVPGTAGQDAQLTVTRAGGGVEPNIQRWISQFPMTAEQPERDTTSVNGLAVHTLTIYGTMRGGTPGGPQQAMDNYGMRGAVVETPSGLVFIKLTGPAETIRVAGDDWRTFTSSVRLP